MTWRGRRTYTATRSTPGGLEGEGGAQQSGHRLVAVTRRLGRTAVFSGLSSENASLATLSVPWNMTHGVHERAMLDISNPSVRDT